MGAALTEKSLSRGKKGGMGRPQRLETGPAA